MGGGHLPSPKGGKSVRTRTINIEFDQTPANSEYALCFQFRFDFRYIASGRRLERNLQTSLRSRRSTFPEEIHALLSPKTGGPVVIQTVVADDEALARQKLRVLLRQETDIQVIGEAA